MPDMRETLKYTFTVEGETEQWYKYYRDNPALSINEAVKQMLAECGVL